MSSRASTRMGLAQLAADERLGPLVVESSVVEIRSRI